MVRKNHRRGREERAPQTGVAPVTLSSIECGPGMRAAIVTAALAAVTDTKRVHAVRI